MDRLERIAYFENALSKLYASLKALDVPLERFAAVQEKAAKLADYFRRAMARGLRG